MVSLSERAIIALALLIYRYGWPKQPFRSIGIIIPNNLKLPNSLIVRNQWLSWPEIKNNTKLINTIINFAVYSL